MIQVNTNSVGSVTSCYVGLIDDNSQGPFLPTSCVAPLNLLCLTAVSVDMTIAVKICYDKCLSNEWQFPNLNGVAFKVPRCCNTTNCNQPQVFSCQVGQNGKYTQTKCEAPNNFACTSMTSTDNSTTTKACSQSCPSLFIDQTAQLYYKDIYCCYSDDCN